MNICIHKCEILGTLIRLLSHKRVDRGMTLIEEQSRCVKRNDVHELVTTDEKGLRPGDRVNRVGFLGFSEFYSPGVIQAGDELYIESRPIGHVVGFDSCHFPNHYNVIIEVPRMVSSKELSLQVGDSVSIVPPDSGVEAEASEPALVPLLVGYGRAGRMHLACTMKAQALCGTQTPILIVDSTAPRDVVGADERLVKSYAKLSDIPRSYWERAIVHLCTPPIIRCSILKEAIDLGARRFIIEKPMVCNETDLVKLSDLETQYQIEVLVVANWTTSALTSAICEQIARRGSLTQVRHLRASHRKPRISWTQANNSHATAIDVELPHMVALTLALGGVACRFVDAKWWDMDAGGNTIFAMGGADIEIELMEGQRAHLHSDLIAPLRERKIQVEFYDGCRLEGYYPCDSNDLYSQLFTFNRRGKLVDRSFFEDDTLTCFLTQAYNYFRGGGNKPLSTLQFHRGVCRILNQARDRCARQAQSKAALHKVAKM